MIKPKTYWRVSNGTFKIADSFDNGSLKIISSQRFRKHTESSYVFCFINHILLYKKTTKNHLSRWPKITNNFLNINPSLSSTSDVIHRTYFTGLHASYMIHNNHFFKRPEQLETYKRKALYYSEHMKQRHTRSLKTSMGIKTYEIASTEKRLNNLL